MKMKKRLKCSSLEKSRSSHRIRENECSQYLTLIIFSRNHLIVFIKTKNRKGYFAQEVFIFCNFHCIYMMQHYRTDCFLKFGQKKVLICREYYNFCFFMSKKKGPYSDMQKLANLTHIFRKNNKQFIKYYRSISLLPICGKIFEKIIIKHMYNHLNSLNLISNNPTGFRPGDYTTNQLIHLVNDIHKSYDNKKSLEV